MRISVHTAATLLVFTLLFTALMAGVYQLTKPVLEATALDAKRRMIAEVLPTASYDNDLLADAIELPANAELDLSEPTRIYRARKNGQPVALVFEAAALNGYSGEIRLILAVQADGRLAAVRVTSHKETPGLGDYIDPKKDKNKTQPWISQFNNRNFSDTPREKWRVKKDGGVIRPACRRHHLGTRRHQRHRSRAGLGAGTYRRPLRPAGQRTLRGESPMSQLRTIVRNGLWNQNAILGQMLGLCSLLAVSTTAVNAISLGIATIAGDGAVQPDRLRPAQLHPLRNPHSRLHPHHRRAGHGRRYGHECLAA